MAKIDVNQYMEQCGVRKARFGGYEPDDVRLALRSLCSDCLLYTSDAADD